MTTAIDRDRLTGDPRRAFGDARKKIRSAISCRLTRTADRMCRFRVFEECRIVLLVHAAAPMQIGNHDAGIHGVDADTFGRDLERSAARQLIDRGLADAVGKHAGKRPQSRSRSTR